MATVATKDDIAGILAEIKALRSDIQTSISEVRGKVDIIEGKVENLKHIQTNVDLIEMNLNARMTDIELKEEGLALKIDDMENRERRLNLKVLGLEEKDGETPQPVKKTVQDITNQLFEEEGGKSVHRKSPQRGQDICSGAVEKAKKGERMEALIHVGAAATPQEQQMQPVTKSDLQDLLAAMTREYQKGTEELLSKITGLDKRLEEVENKTAEVEAALYKQSCEIGEGADKIAALKARCKVLEIKQDDAEN
ncbi:tropomyosin Tod p 1.0102-like [Ambystoma mexicanum]|uniref:tropomyosin Tod p 1.0102-like n=1 Tax=Ambystoma mexicanum TaxID=8296 RepID=UPI0037E99933